MKETCQLHYLQGIHIFWIVEQRLRSGLDHCKHWIWLLLWVSASVQELGPQAAGAASSRTGAGRWPGPLRRPAGGDGTAARWGLCSGLGRDGNWDVAAALRLEGYTHHQSFTHHAEERYLCSNPT